MTVQRNLKQPAKKAKPIARVMVKSIEHRFIGDEPLDVSIKGYVPALNWYNYVFDDEKAREFLLTYLKSADYSKDTIEAVRKAGKYDIPTTVGWVARMLTNGNDIDKTYFDSKIQEIADRTQAPVNKGPKSSVNIQDRTKSKLDLIITDVEQKLDEQGVTFSIYDYLLSTEATPSAAVAIKDYYTPTFNEVMLDDPDVKEAFGKTLKVHQKYWQQFIDDCDRFAGNVKAAKVRKPREKKTKSAVDVVKGLNYQKAFPELKITSVNPADIVGAQQVWLYNTKYRKLTRLDARGPAGLSVKSTTILGYNEETSVTKGVRKPQEIVDRLLKAGKVDLRKFMDDLKATEGKTTGRLNTDIVILRIVK